MSFSNVYVFFSKIFKWFKGLFYSIISIIRREDYSLSDLKKSYTEFAQQAQEYNKINLKNFSKDFISAIACLDKKIKFKSIRIINGTNSKTIKQWKGSQSEEFIYLYNKEIGNTILFNLKKYGDSLQIKIKVHAKVKEFVFWEFKLTGEYVECSNCQSSTQKECFLDYFPKEVYAISYLLYYKNFWVSMATMPLEQYKIKNITEGGNIRNTTIKMEETISELFYDMKDFKKLSGFIFTDFNLLVKQYENFEYDMKTSEIEILIRRLTLSFETTKNDTKINFDVFVSVTDSEEKQVGSAKISLEISNNEEIIRKVYENLSFNLMEIQKEENYLQVILCRLAENIKNPIKAKDGLSIKFMNTSTSIESIKISLKAEEKIEGDHIFTTFIIKNEDLIGKNSNLYDAMSGIGLISITLNGKNGIIGTYGSSIINYESHNCIYSDKLISIPFLTRQNTLQENSKPGFFSKKIIVFVVLIGLFACSGIFAYYYIKNKVKA